MNEETIINSVEIYSPQDPSVGMNAVHITIDLTSWGLVMDNDVKHDFLAEIKEFWGKWLDDKVIVSTEQIIRNGK